MAEEKVKLEYKRKSVGVRQREALKWYKDLVGTKNPTAANFETYREETGLKARVAPGYLQHFVYLAKHRQTLPYYDAFPLSLIADVHDDGFLSFNLHYLSPTWREKALAAISRNMRSNRGPVEKIKINYKMVKEMARLKVFQPCIKKHLFSQIKSKPILIRPQDFHHVIFLPSEDFLGASKVKVWRDSAKIIKG